MNVRAFIPPTAKHDVAQRIAYLLPRQVIYHCLIRAWAEATTGKNSARLATEVTFDEVLREWSEK